MTMSAARCATLALAVGIMSGCSHNPAPMGPLTVKGSDGTILLSVGPLKNAKAEEPFDRSQGSDILSSQGQTTYNAASGIVMLFAGRLADTPNLFSAAAEIDSSLESVATDLQPATVGGQSAVGLICPGNSSKDRTNGVVIFHTSTGNTWFYLSADTAHFDQAWAAATSSIKVAKSVPLKEGTDLRAFTHDTKKYPACTAP